MQTIYGMQSNKSSVSQTKGKHPRNHYYIICFNRQYYSHFFKKGSTPVF